MINVFVSHVGGSVSRSMFVCDAYGFRLLHRLQHLIRPLLLRRHLKLPNRLCLVETLVLVTFAGYDPICIRICDMDVHSFSDANAQGPATHASQRSSPVLSASLYNKLSVFSGAMARC